MTLPRALVLLVCTIPINGTQSNVAKLQNIIAISRLDPNGDFWTLDRVGSLQQYHVVAPPQNFAPLSPKVQLKPAPKIAHILAGKSRVIILDMSGSVISYRPGSGPKKLTIEPSIFSKNPLCLSEDTDELVYLNNSGWVCTETKKRIVKSDEGILRLDKDAIVTWDKGRIASTSRKTGKVLRRSAVPYQFFLGSSERGSIIVERATNSSRVEVVKLNRNLQPVSHLSVGKTITSCDWMGTRVAVVEVDAGWFSTSGRFAVYDAKTGRKVELIPSTGHSSVSLAHGNRILCYDNYECFLIEPEDFQ